MNSFDLGRHADINSKISALRMRDLSRGIKLGKALIKGIELHQDPDHEREIQLTSPKDEVMRLKACGNDKSRWTALHFKLGALDLSDAEVLGVVVRSQAHTRSTVSEVCLRSGLASGFKDYFFPKHLISSTEKGAHLDAVDLGKCPEIPQTAPWRELIVFFSDAELDVSLQNMKFFAL